MRDIILMLDAPGDVTTACRMARSVANPAGFITTTCQAKTRIKIT
jgi:hypothetical protein